MASSNFNLINRNRIIYQYHIFVLEISSFMVGMFRSICRNASFFLLSLSFLSISRTRTFGISYDSTIPYSTLKNVSTAGGLFRSRFSPGYSEVPYPVGIAGGGLLRSGRVNMEFDFSPGWV